MDGMTQDPPKIPMGTLLQLQDMARENPDIKPMEVAQNLDPDLQMAVAEGNPAVLSAIQGGARTSQQVVDVMIQRGFTSGLPPAVQQLVNEQIQAQALKREQENDALKKTGTGILEAAIAATILSNNAKAAEAGNNGSSGGVKWADMSVAEKAQFAAMMDNMTLSQWQGKSQDERMQIDKNIEAEAREALQQNEDKRREYVEKLKTNEFLGNTDQERAKNAELIIQNQEKARAQTMKEMGLSEADFSKMSMDEVNKFEKRVEDKVRKLNHQTFGHDPALEAVANEKGTEYNGFDIRKDHGAVSVTMAKKAQNDNEAKKIMDEFVHGKGSHDHTSVSNKDAQYSVDHADTISTNTVELIKAEGGSLDDKAKALEESREARIAQVDGAQAAAGNKAAVAKMDKARVENAEAGADVYTAALKDKSTQESAPAAADDFAGPQAVVTTSTAPRLTINGQPLAEAGLDQLGVQESKIVASNDAASKPELKRQTPSASMSGGMG